MVTLRPALQKDVVKFYGEPFKETIKGLSAVGDTGEVIGLAAVVHSKPLQAFSDITTELKQSPRDIVRAIHKFRSILNSYGDREIFAIASEKEKTSENFLRHVGFDYVTTTTQGRLFKWQPQSLT